MLYFLVGPSGVGKDTVLEKLKKYDYGNKQAVLVAHRYITRPPVQDDENHVELTTADFNTRKDSDLFLFNWQSHGNQYGIGKEVTSWLDAGHDVVVNGSRNYLEEAHVIYPDLKVVWLTVSEDILRERLTQRGRESDQEIEDRIARTLMIDTSNTPSDKIIYNDQSADETVKDVIKWITNKS